MSFSPLAWGLAAVAAFAAGFLDSIAGGGGIITVPVLLAVGLPPHMALGTNKLQASFGSFTATMRYGMKGLYKLENIWPGIIFTFIGAVIGTWLVQRLDGGFLNRLIPFMLLVLFLYTLFQPRLGEKDSHARWPAGLFWLVFGLSIGFYDGFFGPGTGSFWTIALVTLLGLNLKNATGTTKPMNFTSNIVSLSVFLIGGNVLIPLGLLMGAAQFAGAWLGSHLVLRRSPRFIRIFLLIAVGATILRLLQVQYLG